MPALAKMYKEVGAAWTEGVRRRLEDVQGFHDQLIVNRRAFLQTEISRLERTLAQRAEEVRRFSDERAVLLQVLDTHGALAEYTELQSMQNEEIAKLSAVNQKIANLKRIDEIKGQTRIERDSCKFWRVLFTRSAGPDANEHSHSITDSRKCYTIGLES